MSDAGLKDSAVKDDVLAVVAAAPEGRVLTYRALGGWLGVSARQVAYLLGQLSPQEADAAPWHRVVGDEGWLGAVKVDSSGRSQEERLLAEGVSVSQGRLMDFEQVRIAVAELDSGVPQRLPAEGAADWREP